MAWVAGIRFKPAGKIYNFECENIELTADDAVIVETVRGVEFGTVVVGKREMSEDELILPLKSVIRKVTEEDKQTYATNKQQEQEALEICKSKVREHNLPMHLIDVEYTFDRGKIIFYFTAEGRVDFRELVKDLAAIFKTRIELRQIGVRDEAKMLGGVGTCGRILCCKCFLGEFEPVSIRMAKEQNLSLNPTKISGICGRLMCCLKYESALYNSKRQGEKVNGEDAPGTKNDNPGVDN
ncbi:MAG: stage 0 sporulation family protein [Syntrophomonadaceae bacterium]|nr:stage 0 sporulation family protein [Syntrophomonadaceae bacterium]MDD3890033.1 stage 0 sporulation family protein [Syntrophomonadaceae bacterium]MDD4549848.1 stage 0 sporulation family protein [Syntrophomonadaceae bacterium]